MSTSDWFSCKKHLQNCFGQFTCGEVGFKMLIGDFFASRHHLSIEMCDLQIEIVSRTAHTTLYTFTFYQWGKVRV